MRLCVSLAGGVCAGVWGIGDMEGLGGYLEHAAQVQGDLSAFVC